MSTVLITKGMWPQLSNATRAAKQRCAVAVAYFGKGASRLLPLRKGSSLVVDASEAAVKSGQTHPPDLLAMVEKGVRVFSLPNLHAKVFVLGRVAFIGSANVSNRSADTLIEAAIRTSDAKAVKAAREFVLQQCLHELTPGLLKTLAKLYRPPKFPGGKSPHRPIAKNTQSRPVLPRLLLVQLHYEDWNDRDQKLHDAGEVVAKTRRKHPRSFEMESFRRTGSCPFRRKDVVIQVTDEGNGRKLVSPPGNVLHVKTRKDPHGRVSFVYLEHPSDNRRDAKKLASKLGPGAKKSLGRNGEVRDKAFAQALLNLWGATK